MSVGGGLLMGSLLLALLALPLALGLVPPNRLYGLRPFRCPEDPTAWQAVNVFAGRVFLGIGALGILISRLPRYLSPARQVGFFLVLLLGSAVVIWVRTRLEGRGV